jgi:hypothetical protein
MILFDFVHFDLIIAMLQRFKVLQDTEQLCIFGFSSNEVLQIKAFLSARNLCEALNEQEHHLLIDFDLGQQ